MGVPAQERASRSRALDRIIEEVVAPLASRVDEQSTFPRAGIDVLAQAGFLALTVAEEDGGAGGTVTEFGDVVRRLASSCMSTAMVYVMHVTALNSVLALPASERRARMLRRIVTERLLLTEAISEPGSGSQWWSVESVAEKIPGGYRIHADKSFATSAGYADLYIVSTRTPGSDNDRDHAIFAVRADHGEIVTGQWRGLGLAGNSSTWIRFRSEVDEDALLYAGGDGRGLRQYNEVNQPIYHLGIAAAYLGVATAAFDSCVDRIRTRHYRGNVGGFGAKLRDYPVARRHVGEMAVSLETAKCTVAELARRIDAGEGLAEIAVHMTAAKVYCAQIAVRVAHQAMMASGGTAYAKGVLPIERHLRDALAGSLMGPNDDFCKELIGKLTIEDASYHDL
jgi:alkylation response protein AidB-like acyl-CoA dehydrogenase